ncbi:MAG: DUF4276 family protein [Chloroflexota bacterium]
MPDIACIVEGQGDEQALPILIRRVSQLLNPPRVINVFVSKRASRDKLIGHGGIEAAVEEAARSTDSGDAILILLDADDACPAALGPDLLSRARQVRPDRSISVVLAKREFEAWFVAACTSLRGRRGFAPDTMPPVDPEGIRDAKGWLGKQIPHGRKYSETADQPAFAAIFSIEAARQADSFDKCYREIKSLIESTTGNQSQETTS